MVTCNLVTDRNVALYENPIWLQLNKYIIIYQILFI